MAELRPNRVKEKLAAGEIVTCLAGVDTPYLVDFVGQIGVDAVWLEAEHGPVSFDDVGNLSRAADLWGMTPIVRVESTDYSTIYRTLDMGAMGIVVPHVDTVEDARAVVEATKYAPIGRRGMYQPRQSFGVTDYLVKANDQSMSIVLIEDIQAVNTESVGAIDIVPSEPPKQLIKVMTSLGLIESGSKMVSLLGINVEQPCASIIS